MVAVTSGILMLPKVALLLNVMIPAVTRLGKLMVVRSGFELQLSPSMPLANPTNAGKLTVPRAALESHVIRLDKAALARTPNVTEVMAGFEDAVKFPLFVVRAGKLSAERSVFDDEVQVPA